MPNFEEMKAIIHSLNHTENKSAKFMFNSLTIRKLIEVVSLSEKLNSYLEQSLNSNDHNKLLKGLLLVMGIGITFFEKESQRFLEKLSNIKGIKKRKSDENIPTLFNDPWVLWNQSNQRTRRPKFLFDQDPPTLYQADEKTDVKHCICQKLNTNNNLSKSSMAIGCDRCKNWFHVDCVGGKDKLESLNGKKFNVSSLKTFLCYKLNCQ